MRTGASFIENRMASSFEDRLACSCQLQRGTTNVSPFSLQDEADGSHRVAMRWSHLARLNELKGHMDCMAGIAHPRVNQVYDSPLDPPTLYTNSVPGLKQTMMHIWPLPEIRSYSRLGMQRAFFLFDMPKPRHLLFPKEKIKFVDAFRLCFHGILPICLLFLCLCRPGVIDAAEKQMLAHLEDLLVEIHGLLHINIAFRSFDNSLESFHKPRRIRINVCSGRNQRGVADYFLPLLR